MLAHARRSVVRSSRATPSFKQKGTIVNRRTLSLAVPSLFCVLLFANNLTAQSPPKTRNVVLIVTDGIAFSYPGYNDMLTGFPDPKIDSNELGPNPNVTVFEWLNKQPEFHGKVAVFGTWSTYKDIFNINRSHLPIQAGWDLPYRGTLSPNQQLINDLYLHTTKLDEEDRLRLPPASAPARLRSR